MNSINNHSIYKKNISNAITGLIIFSSLLLFCVPRSYGEGPFWSIALSKFSNEQDAQMEEAKLKNSGHSAFYREEKNPDNSNVQYQVYIEKYTSRDEAETEAMVLKDLDLISEYTVVKISETPQTAQPEKNTADKTDTEEIIPDQAETEMQAAEPLPEKAETHQPDQIPGIEKQIMENEQPHAINDNKQEKTETENKATEPVPEIEEQTAEDKQSQENKKPEQLIEEAEKNESEYKAKTEEKSTEQAKQVDNSESEINTEPDQFTGESLQVGAFKEESNAASIKLKLQNLGKNAFYLYESAGSKGAFYRLYITGYNSLTEAIGDARILLDSGVISGYSRVHRKTEPTNSPQRKIAPKTNKGNVYFIQLSSDKGEVSAAEDVDRLKNDGLNAFYVHETGLSDSWYTIYIGTYGDEAEAKEKGMELLNKGLITDFKTIAIELKKIDN